VIDQLIALIFISLACAFISNVITRQNGPMFIFSAFRMMLSLWSTNKSITIGSEINSGISDSRRTFLLRKSKAIKSFAELFSCPFCIGPWLILIVSLIVFGFEGLLVNWFAGSGLLYIWLGLINGRS